MLPKVMLVPDASYNYGYFYSKSKDDWAPISIQHPSADADRRADDRRHLRLSRRCSLRPMHLRVWRTSMLGWSISGQTMLDSPTFMSGASICGCDRRTPCALLVPGALMDPRHARGASGLTAVESWV